VEAARAIVVPLRGADPYGKIDISLRASRDYASLNGLEAIDESR
jgi:hypothetical protein